MSDFNHYFIANNVETSTDILALLSKQNVSEDKIGVVSKDPEIVKADVPEVPIDEKTELPEAMQRGALVGTGTGLLAGVILALFPVTGFAFGGAFIATMAAGGGMVGSWSASMIGISEQSPLLAIFDDHLDKGKTIILCQLTDSQLQQMQGSLRSKDAGIVHGPIVE